MLPDNQNGFNPNPRIFFFATLTSVFIIEVIVMFFLKAIPELPLAGEAFLDACLLAIFLTPFLYWLLLKPLQTNIQRLGESKISHRNIQEENSLKTELISVAAHELRSPLSTIMGYSELLLTGDHFDESQKKEFAAIIHQKSTTIERLIDDLLDISHLESGQNLSICKNDNNIFATTTLLLQEYRKRYPQRPFTVNFPETSDWIAYDRVRMDQVFDNILGNAIKFSPPDSPIDIEGVPKDTNIQFKIRDRGIGMPPGELSRVFDKFYRAGVSSASPSGLGLGMAIVKGIVTSHGGEIWLESSPGEGTTVRFTIPRG